MPAAAACNTAKSTAGAPAGFFDLCRTITATWTAKQANPVTIRTAPTAAHSLCAIKAVKRITTPISIRMALAYTVGPSIGGCRESGSWWFDQPSDSRHRLDPPEFRQQTGHMACPNQYPPQLTRRLEGAMVHTTTGRIFLGFGHFLEHAAAVVLGLVFIIVGLALGVTMIMLPVGVVVA